MAAIGDVLSDTRELAGQAFTAPDRSTDYSYREFCAAAWKSGNLLRQYGVHDGATVTVLVGTAEPATRGRPGDTPEPLFAILGAWLLGATVDLDPGETIEGAAVVGPPKLLDRHEVAPGCSVLAYGESASDPATGQFERERWSENPVEPPNDVSPDAVALTSHPRLTQRSLVDTAGTAVADGVVRAGDRVGIDAPLGPRTLSTGVLAPLMAEATIVGGHPDALDLRVTGDGETRLSD